MTIGYSGRFSKLLFRWRASLWECVWKELIVFLSCYYCLASVYRFALDTESRKTFGKVVTYLDETVSTSIPISYLLGLYVVTITKRWWDQFENVAWPDDLMFVVSAYMTGSDENTLIQRRNIARYSVLAAALAWRNLSSRVFKRFPTIQHLTRSGLMTSEEVKMYEDTNAPFGRWFLPLNWIQSIVVGWKKEGKLDPAGCKQILVALHSYRTKFIRLFVGDWIHIPLIYTQVATVSTYGYFALCVISRQYLDAADSSSNRHYNLYVPFTTILQFLLYVGWLKIAEKLLHPFGDEDNDFELNYFLDRHLYVALMIVDELHDQKPPVEKDAFWGVEPHIPHTKASRRIRDRKPDISGNITLPFNDMEFVERQNSFVPNVNSHCNTFNLIGTNATVVDQLARE